MPVKPQGSIAVIAHVVWADGVEEWRPARAIRWTATHVMVPWLEDDKNPRSERYEWLHASDVARTISWFVAPPARPVESGVGTDGAARDLDKVEVTGRPGGCGPVPLRGAAGPASLPSPST